VTQKKVFHNIIKNNLLQVPKDHDNNMNSSTLGAIAA